LTLSTIGGAEFSMKRTLPWYCSAAAATLLLVAGCDAGAGSPAPVRGKIAYRSLPLHTGTIVFTPDASRGTTGVLVRADIRPDGTYSLGTTDANGAPPGWYRVTIMAMEGSSTGGYTVPRSLLPDKYRDPDLSGLSCKVQANQENIIDFNLE
jgi:hypothetical protein